MQGVWSDVHTMLIGYIRDALGEELPADLTARAEENVTLSGPVEGQPRKADVAVLEPWKQGERPLWTPESDPELANRVAEPILVETDDVTPRWIEIRSSKGKLITVIEVTSPANKTKSGRIDFENKVRDLLGGGVNVMEIDLIRGGFGAKNFRTGNWPQDHCQIIVNRPHRSRFAEVYACPLREPLPAVRVPLRPDEPDAALDLQPLIDQCYSRGRYWMLPYKDAPQCLSDEDLQWARSLLEDS